MKKLPAYVREGVLKARREPDYAYRPSETLACVEGAPDEPYMPLDDFTPFDEWKFQ